MGNDTSKQVTSSTSSETITSNMRPLEFHQVHGNNIELQSKFVALRPTGFNHGITYSDRVVMVMEPIHIKILETANNWSGSIRIGFTANDPKSMKSKLPAHSCPDLISIPGNWVKAIPESRNQENAVLSYHVDANGDVYYGIDGEDKKFLLSGVNTSGKLWAVIDIYGNTVCIEMIDPNSATANSDREYQLNNSIAFHNIHSESITLKCNRWIASRKDDTVHYSYVFSDRPLKLGEKVLVQILQIDPCFSGSFEYGVTSCNPSSIYPETLPSDTEELLDWSDHWVVNKDSNCYNAKDIITFTINTEGKITVSKNCNSVSAVFHVDNSQPLWLFYKLSGSVTDIFIKTTSVNQHADMVKEFECLKVSEKETVPSPSECVICCENTVSSVLYRCGHMCMCYDCAITLFKPESKVQCPICREVIDDVIKVYT